MGRGGMMIQILSNKDNFILIYCDENQYCFGSKQDFKSAFGVPVGQSGTIDEVIETLERWKNTVDINNVYMQKIECTFLSILYDIKEKPIS